jgi:hypothetical protein
MVGNRNGDDARIFSNAGVVRGVGLMPLQIGLSRAVCEEKGEMLEIARQGFRPWSGRLWAVFLNRIVEDGRSG